MARDAIARGRVRHAASVRVNVTGGVTERTDVEKNKMKSNTEFNACISVTYERRLVRIAMLSRKRRSNYLRGVSV